MALNIEGLKISIETGEKTKKNYDPAVEREIENMRVVKRSPAPANSDNPHKSYFEYFDAMTSVKIDTVTAEVLVECTRNEILKTVLECFDKGAFWRAHEIKDIPSGIYEAIKLIEPIMLNMFKKNNDISADEKISIYHTFKAFEENMKNAIKIYKSEVDITPVSDFVFEVRDKFFKKNFK